MTRPAVISLRVTAREHERLRAKAAARGLSISDLIRSWIMQETQPALATETTSAARGLGRRSVVIDGIGTGVFWKDITGAVAEGATLTLSRGWT